MWLLCIKDLEQSFERNHCKNTQFVSGVNCLRRLIAFVKEKDPGNNKCLKVRQKQMEKNLFAAQTNQSDMFPGIWMYHPL
jgi:hypothetical protein